MLRDIIQQIAAYQPHWNRENTHEMQKRGVLIRDSLPDELKLRTSLFAEALSPFATDMDIKGSDGVGHKGEAPWVRIFSKEFSPRPTQGYYVVFHFSIDGSTVFVTLGCPSKVWNAEQNSFKDRPKNELKKKVDLTRKYITSQDFEVSKFLDKIRYRE